MTTDHLVQAKDSPAAFRERPDQSIKTRWAIMSSDGSTSDPHQDTGGQCVYITVVDGAKLFFIGEQNECVVDLKRKDTIRQMKWHPILVRAGHTL